MHVCNLKKSYYQCADPYHQFFVEESQGNQEILKIFDNSSFISLNGAADFSLGQTICKLEETKGFPGIHPLPGPHDSSQAFIRLTFSPASHTSSALQVSYKEQVLRKSLSLLDDQISVHRSEKSGLIIKKEKAQHPQKHLNRIYLELEFSNKAGEPSFKTIILIHLLTPDNAQNPLYKGIIDFGSDALQMRIINPHGNRDDIDILSKIAENFYGYEEEEIRRPDRGKQFYQELADKTLFKSDIFIRNKNGKSSTNDPPGIPTQEGGIASYPYHKTEDTAELVNVLTSTQIEELWTKHRFLAPNLKLSILKDFFNKRIQFEKEEDNPDPMGSQDVSFAQLNHLIYRIALNKFLHTLFLVIRKATRESISPYVHLTLLVPNVYRQSLIHQLTTGLLKDWQEELYRKYQISGLEIQIMSESDATFLGMLNNLDPQYQDQYLIIDGGKGTTDISIIRVDKEADKEDIKSYSSIYRDGFIGAGNLISYAFIETVLAIFYSEDASKRREFMETYLLSDSPKANLNEIINFLGLIEQLKISYKDPSVKHLKAEEIRAHIKSAYLENLREDPLRLETLDSAEMTLMDYIDNNESNTPLETLNKWIINTFKIDNSDGHAFQKSCTLSDDFRFISKQVDEMANTFSQHLSALKVDGKKMVFKKILFAGRSFLFQDLLEKMKEKLADFVDTDQGGLERNFMTMANNPKKVCLHGALGQQEVNHLSSLIGIPFVNQPLSNFRNPKLNIEKDPDTIDETYNSQGLLTKETRYLKKIKYTWQLLKGKLMPLINWLNRNFGLHLDQLPVQDWNKRNISELDIPFFLHGSKVIPRGSHVFINGDKINLDKWMQGHDFKLFYGGEDYYCRILDEDGDPIETRKIDLQLEDNSQKDEDLIKSVFPFIELGGSRLPISMVQPEAFINDEAENTAFAEKYLQQDSGIPDIEEMFGKKESLGESPAFVSSHVDQSPEHTPAQIQEEYSPISTLSLLPISAAEPDNKLSHPKENLNETREEVIQAESSELQTEAELTESTRFTGMENLLEPTDNHTDKENGQTNILGV